MIGILSLILVLGISLIVTRVASIALKNTGISEDVARFQARSALTGCGFTTSESEDIVNHPIRRKIIMMLMLVGNAGIITAISSLMIGFVGEQHQSLLFRFSSLLLGLLLIWYLAKSDKVEKMLSSAIEKALDNYPALKTANYDLLLRTHQDYEIHEITVCKDDWVVEKEIGELNLSKEGIVILGIEREQGHYIGSPQKDTTIHEGDTLLVYGKKDNLIKLDERKSDTQGEKEHIESKKVHEKEVEEQKKLDEKVLDGE